MPGLSPVSQGTAGGGILKQSRGKTNQPSPPPLPTPPPVCRAVSGRWHRHKNPAGAAPRTAHPCTGQVAPLGWHASRKHPKGDASTDVILPSVGLRALLKMQVSLSHSSLSIVVPSSTERLISMVQSQVAMSPCPKGASAAQGGSWVTADALCEPHADGDEVPSPFLSWGSFGFTT